MSEDTPTAVYLCPRIPIHVVSQINIICTCYFKKMDAPASVIFSYVWGECGTIDNTHLVMEEIWVQILSWSPTFV